MIIQSKRVWLEEEFKPAQVEIVGNIIKEVYTYGEKSVDKDYGDNIVMPGLIDIHNHGYNGGNANYATKEWLHEWAGYLPKEGVTGILVTTSTAPVKNITESLKVIADVIEEKPVGANLLGIHVEGPQISHEFRGAQSAYEILRPSVEQFKEWQSLANGNIKYIAIAAENDVDLALTKYCSENGVQVALGHTGAKMETCRKAESAGAKSFTHTFNGMLGIHHREPGTAGAAMRLEDMYAELICDGVHVHFDVAHILAKAKGKDRLIAITDSVQIKGLKPGVYDFPGRYVVIGEDGCGRLKDGRLAGSSNKQNKMLQNLIEKIEAPLVTAINATTINPLRLLGMDNHKGLIKVGYDADIAVFDSNYDAIQTYVMGKEML